MTISLHSFQRGDKSTKHQDTKMVKIPNTKIPKYQNTKMVFVHRYTATLRNVRFVINNPLGYIKSQPSLSESEAL